MYGYLEEVRFNNYNCTDGDLYIIASGTNYGNTVVFTTTNPSGAAPQRWLPRDYVHSNAGAEIFLASGLAVGKIPIYQPLYVAASGLGNGKSGNVTVVISTP